MESRKIIKVSETPSIKLKRKISQEQNERLELEGSISESESRNLKLNPDETAKKNVTEPWYFTHM